MSEKETGGSAYPLENAGTEFQRGMTLRDYFAGQAIAGLLQSTDLKALKPIADKNKITMVQAFGVMAYNYADAMLEARK